MESIERVLVTTSLEKTWPVDRSPILFLGEWCRLYDRKNSWQGLDAVVAPYHWDNRKKLHKDYLYLKLIYTELLELLAIKLNEIHKVDHLKQYWRILIGPWLGYFIQILFDRYTMLRQVYKDYVISGVRVLGDGEHSIPPNDMRDFLSYLEGDVWNESIYGQILGWMGANIEYINNKNDLFSFSGNHQEFAPRSSLRKNLVGVVNQVFHTFSRKDEYFFIASYLDLRQEIHLQLKLGQLPKLGQSLGIPRSVFDCKKRLWNISTSQFEDDFVDLVCKLIPEQIPISYLEGYQDLVLLAENLKWPKLPKAIFTSNAFLADDVFKLWAGTKTEKGTPLIVGQHGGNYGMSKWSFSEEHEIAISDYYLTWGWGKGDHKKLIPVGIMKNFGKKYLTPSNNGLIYMIEMSLPRYSYHCYSIPVASQLLSYFEDQFRFVAELPKELRDKLLVRLSPEDYGWSQKLRWLDRYPGINLDDCSQSMWTIMKKSKIFISTYNATTYLESMAMNFPTVIFWDPKHWELRDSALPFFEKLRSVGIFHESPESAARHVAKVWSNVMGWWVSPETQMARKEFCEHYAWMPKDSLDVMNRLFRQIGGSA